LTYFGTLRPLGMSYKRGGAQKPPPSSAKTASPDGGGQSIRSVVEDVIEAVSESRDTHHNDLF
jgi:hypothetical protein